MKNANRFNRDDSRFLVFNKGKLFHLQRRVAEQNPGEAHVASEIDRGFRVFDQIAEARDRSRADLIVKARSHNLLNIGRGQTRRSPRRNRAAVRIFKQNFR